MLRISQIKLKPGESTDLLPAKVGKALRIKNFSPDSWKIVRESVDARKKPDIYFVYTVDFEVKDQETLLKRAGAMKDVNLTLAPDNEYHIPENLLPEGRRPVVAGLGPCGMFAALILAEAGARPLVLERGRRVEERTRDVEKFWESGQLDTESNVQFGEGGAGTFSDGKLTTGIKDPRIAKVNEEFILAGADPSIAYSALPHIGTDVLRTVVKNIREKIISLGGEIRFESKVTGLETESLPAGKVPETAAASGEDRSSRLKAVIINDRERLDCRDLVLAPGNSARDTFRMLSAAGVKMEAKPFSVGFRIEHPQQLINDSQYGPEANDSEGRLGAAAYKLSFRSKGGRGVYTFCMCPGGRVVAAASEENTVVTNGMSYRARDGKNANSAILVDIRPEDCGPGPLDGIALQEQLEAGAFGLGGGGYYAPVQKLEDFLKGQPSRPPAHGEKIPVEPTYRPGVTWTDLSGGIPDFAAEAMREALPAMAKKLKGFDMKDAVLTGVETRSSCPVRILRDRESLQSLSTEGLYPGGEGAGYAGGIMSAAVDGIKLAEKILSSVSK